MRLRSSRTWLVLAVVLALGVTLAGCGSGASGSNGELRVRLALIAEGYDAPLFYAQKLGYFKDAGLNVKIEESTGSSTTTKLVGNGSADIGFADLATAAKGIAQNVPVKAIGAVFQSTPLSTVFLDGRGIKKPADLKGKIIGEQPGSATSQYFPAFQSNVGLSQGDTSKVNIDAGAREQLLLTGKINAFNSYWNENVPILEVHHKVKAHAFKWSEYGLKMLGLGIIVNESAVDGKADELRKFLAAYTKGYVAAAKNPKAAASSILDQFKRAGGGSVETLEKQWLLSQTLQHSPESNGRPLLWMAPQAWQNTLATNAKYAEISSDKPASEYYTNNLNPKTAKPAAPSVSIG